MQIKKKGAFANPQKQKPIKEAPLNPRTAMLKTMGRLKPGLVIVSCHPSILASVRGAVERQLRGGRSQTGLRFPLKQPILSLYAGTSRSVDQARALSSAQAPVDGAAKHDFQCVGTRDGFAWCSDEGLHALEPLIRETKGWLTLAQASGDCSVTTMIDAVLRIRTAAKRAAHHVVLFLTADQPHEALRLQDFCDEHIVVERCEREPDSVATFSVVCTGLSDLHDLGIGKSMCTAKFDGIKYTWSWEFFLSTKVLDRVIWKLRSENKSLAEIGEIVGLHKSNVHRHLADLPSPRPIDLPKKWLKRYAEVIGINTEPAPAAKDASIRGDQQDG